MTTTIDNDLVDTLQSSDIADSAITGAKIADGAITEDKVETSALLAVNPFGAQLIHIQDQKSSGTDGGTFTAGAWQTRDLNTTLTNEVTGASLTSNQITLPAGTYHIEASTPVFSGGSALSNHQAKLRDTTGGADLILGTSEIVIQGAASTGASNRSFISGRFTLSVESVIEVQHQCTVTASNNGFGAGAGFGTEVFTDVKVWKLG